MNPIQVLTIEDCFALSDGRLLVVPDFATIDGLALPMTLAAHIAKPDGSIIDCKLSLTLTHFNMPGSTDITQRWRIVPGLDGVTKSDLTPGDRLCIFDTHVAALLRRSGKPAR